MSESPHQPQHPAAVPGPRRLRVFRVFLSSPGDVADERTIVRSVLKQDLPSRAFLRGRATFEVVSWDDPAAPTPMLATLTPQEAVNRRDMPSACDIVVVILWSRLGTPLPDTFRKPNGERYLSGTEWEYEDACTAEPPPPILVYRRTEPVNLDPDDPNLDKRLEQYKRVKKFFSRFENPDGSLKGGVNTYATPAEFKEIFAKHMEELILPQLDERDREPDLAAKSGGCEVELPSTVSSTLPSTREPSSPTMSGISFIARILKHPCVIVALAGTFVTYVLFYSIFPSEPLGKKETTFVLAAWTVLAAAFWSAMRTIRILLHGRFRVPAEQAGRAPATAGQFLRPASPAVRRRR